MMMATPSYQLPPQHPPTAHIHNTHHLQLPPLPQVQPQLQPHIAMKSPLPRMHSECVPSFQAPATLQRSAPHLGPRPPTPVQSTPPLTVGLSPNLGPSPLSLPDTHHNANAKCPMMIPIQRRPQPEVSARAATTHIYTPQEFCSFRNDLVHTPGHVLEWTESLYKAPSGLHRPSHLRLFNYSDDERLLGGLCRTRGLRLSNRGVHHKVMSILSRVTREKYDQLRDELTRLPLRQASDTELVEVVNVFFDKSVNEPTFSDLYARLVADLCNMNMNTSEQALPQEQKEKWLGERLRQLLLNTCRDAFTTQPLELSDADKQDPTNGKLLSEHVIEEKRTILRQRLNGNIKFVGELYMRDLLKWNVIESICKLLVGEYETKPDKEDYLFEMFRTLMLTTGNKLNSESPDGVRELMRVCGLIVERHKVSRIRFLMMNLFDVAKKDWKLDIKCPQPNSSNIASQEENTNANSTTNVSNSNNNKEVQNPRSSSPLVEPTRRVGSSETTSNNNVNNNNISQNNNNSSQNHQQTPPPPSPQHAHDPYGLQQPTPVRRRTANNSQSPSTPITPSHSSGGGAGESVGRASTPLSSAAPPPAAQAAPSSTTTVVTTTGMPLRQQSPSMPNTRVTRSPLSQSCDRRSTSSPSQGTGNNMFQEVSRFRELFQSDPASTLDRMATMDRSTLIPMLARWIHEAVTNTAMFVNNQYEVPQLLAAILERCEETPGMVLSASDVITTLHEAVRLEVESRSFEESPRLCQNWGIIVKEAFKAYKDAKTRSGFYRLLAVLNAQHFTIILRELLAHNHRNFSVTAIKDLYPISQELCSMADIMATKEPRKTLMFATQCRFRLLPYVLRCDEGNSSSRIRTPTTPLQQAAPPTPERQSSTNTSSLSNSGLYTNIQSADPYGQCFAVGGEDAELQKYKRIIRKEEDPKNLPVVLDGLRDQSGMPLPVTRLVTAMKLTAVTLCLLHPPQGDAPRISLEESYTILKDVIARVGGDAAAAQAAVTMEMISFFCCNTNKALGGSVSSSTSTPMRGGRTGSTPICGPHTQQQDELLGTICDMFHRWCENGVVDGSSALSNLTMVARNAVPSTPSTPARNPSSSELDGSFRLPESQPPMMLSSPGAHMVRRTSTPLNAAGVTMTANTTSPSVPGTPAQRGQFRFDSSEMVVRSFNFISILKWNEVLSALQKV